jgi:hypothetical protein
MNLARVEAVVNAVLYEGYMLYPYRPSSVKNRQRWTFGGVYPPDYTAQDENSACHMQTECLVRGGPETEVELHVRFLQVVTRRVGALPAPLDHMPLDHEPAFTEVASLAIGGQIYRGWEESIERDVTASALPMSRLMGEGERISFSFTGERVLEPVAAEHGRVEAVLIRTSARLDGEVMIAAEEVAPGVSRLTIGIANLTRLDPAPEELRAEAHRRAFASTHTILGLRGGAFVSLLDPPDALKDIAASCRNIGTWPVLAGAPGATDMLLSSPIILYDHPQVAPESPGDLFDATEIDEILTLRILAMTDDEKREMAAIDPRSRALLERTEALTAADMERLHGTLRDPRFGLASHRSALNAEAAFASKPELAFVHLDGRDLKVGDRVRLRPKRGGDVMDIVLKDELAVIEAIERDFEDRVHVAVVIDADPGREFGLERMPGHRFFFSPEEIEPIEVDAPA